MPHLESMIQVHGLQNKVHMLQTKELYTVWVVASSLLRFAVIHNHMLHRDLTIHAKCDFSYQFSHLLAFPCTHAMMIHILDVSGWWQSSVCTLPLSLGPSIMMSQRLIVAGWTKPKLPDAQLVFGWRPRELQPPCSATIILGIQLPMCYLWRAPTQPPLFSKLRAFQWMAWAETSPAGTLQCPSEPQGDLCYKSSVLFTAAESTRWNGHGPSVHCNKHTEYGKGNVNVAQNTFEMPDMTRLLN